MGVAQRGAEAAARALVARAVDASGLLEVHHALGLVLRAGGDAARVWRAEGRDTVAGRAEGAARADDVDHPGQAVGRA